MSGFVIPAICCTSAGRQAGSQSYSNVSVSCRDSYHETMVFCGGIGAKLKSQAWLRWRVVLTGVHHQELIISVVAAAAVIKLHSLRMNNILLVSTKRHTSQRNNRDDLHLHLTSPTRRVLLAFCTNRNIMVVCSRMPDQFGQIDVLINSIGTTGISYMIKCPLQGMRPKPN